MAWGVTGLLREKAVAHAGGRGVRGASKIPEAQRLVRDDVDELAVELMFVAVAKFRTKTLLNPNPGTTLVALWRCQHQDVLHRARGSHGAA